MDSGIDTVLRQNLLYLVLLYLAVYKRESHNRGFKKIKVYFCFLLKNSHGTIFILKMVLGVCCTRAFLYLTTEFLGSVVLCFPSIFYLTRNYICHINILPQRQWTPDSLCTGLQGKGSVFPVLVSG